MLKELPSLLAAIISPSILLLLMATELLPSMQCVTLKCCKSVVDYPKPSYFDVQV